MIKNFEKYTHELTDDEKVLLPQFINGLKTKIGKQNAVSNKHIRSRFKTINVNVSDARVRKIINHIRINNLLPLLCSNSKGYFVARNIDEIEEYLKGLQQRISAQVKVHEAISLQLEFKELSKQIKLKNEKSI